MESTPVSTNQETPVRPKSILTDVSYQSGRLDRARLTVFEDLGESIPEIYFPRLLGILSASSVQVQL